MAQNAVVKHFLKAGGNLVHLTTLYIDLQGRIGSTFIEPVAVCVDEAEMMSQRERYLLFSLK